MRLTVPLPEIGHEQHKKTPATPPREFAAVRGPIHTDPLGEIACQQLEALFPCSN
ncbi:MAG: hypothetical protein CM1200mP3_13290 [Chloroflexota bacterium]|nr:MAG: hypothetical protein CM1200mP3_13290 [Chloroflexota bacterium]